MKILNFIKNLTIGEAGGDICKYTHHVCHEPISYRIKNVSSHKETATQ